MTELHFGEMGEELPLRFRPQLAEVLFQFLIRSRCGHGALVVAADHVE